MGNRSKPITLKTCKNCNRNYSTNVLDFFDIFDIFDVYCEFYASLHFTHHLHSPPCKGSPARQHCIWSLAYTFFGNTFGENKTPTETIPSTTPLKKTQTCTKKGSVDVDFRTNKCFKRQAYSTDEALINDIDDIYFEFEENP